MHIWELFSPPSQIRDSGPKHSWRSLGWFDRSKFYSPENPIKRLCTQEHAQWCVTDTDTQAHTRMGTFINTQLIIACSMCFYVGPQIHPRHGAREQEETEREREIIVITSSPHNVTATSLPVVSIRLRALLETSLLVFVVIRDTSSALLHTPITSAERKSHFTSPSICSS